MNARLISFRTARRHQKMKHMLLEIDGCDTRAKAAQHIGSRVIWTTPAKRKIYGKIVSPHGNNGVIRAIFSKGLPGDALTTTVEVVQKRKVLKPAKEAQTAKAPKKAEVKAAAKKKK